jgi:hypothetical protein
MFVPIDSRPKKSFFSFSLANFFVCLWDTPIYGYFEIIMSENGSPNGNGSIFLITYQCSLVTKYVHWAKFSQFARA